MTSEVKELVERLQEWATNLDGLAPVEAARGVADLRQAADTLQSQERRIGELEAATHMAWHAGYEAGATENAAFSAGYAQAERDIMDWLRGPGPDRDNGGPCRHVDHAMGHCSCAELAESISRSAHRDRDRHPEGGDAERGSGERSELEPGPSGIAQNKSGD